ncbi:hypothetical protein H261_16473 [Paramagnetospirillum caucaseum]|uniref:HPt domain-containing protein n=1 Tax=Paramagnetospirillum caucaseum TaxID=1244869 RepID=M2ZNF0_9PROT|nr:Hpt domain-containing protein [Paramagnetospirillum caucaseum]EME68827.1 hypothetical protein H261_16473 [Paramagnetospirillum caucaseum]
MSDSFEDFMVELRQEFLGKLPAHSRTITDAWRDAMADRERKEALSRLATNARHLAGAGRTFGCPEISEAAETLEFCLIKVRRGANIRLEEMTPFIAELIAAINWAHLEKY